MFHVYMDISGDEQVNVAVAIIISPGGTGG